MQRFDLPESLDITAETFARDARAVACSDELVLGAASVHRIDAAGVQLLYALVVAAKARGARVVWDSPSRIVIDAVRAAGLARHLDVPAT